MEPVAQARPLPPGTRIRFRETIDDGPTGDSPGGTWARRGERGSVLGPGFAGGYSVRTDDDPAEFTVWAYEIEVLEEPT